MSGAHTSVDVMAKKNSYLSVNFREFDGFTVFSLSLDSEEVRLFLETEQVGEFKKILQQAIDSHEMGRIEKEGESLPPTLDPAVWKRLEEYYNQVFEEE